jgi:predicted nucleotide-binding protein (sugar kinase/HSP70/actin superfamily)
MLRISTSQIGYLSVGMKTLARELGHEWVEPERPGLSGLQRTRRLSPEYCCYPFRLALADCLSALDRGADTIVFFGGKGICRLAMYQAAQREILEHEGRAFRAHVVSGGIRESLYGILREESPYRDSWTYTPRTFLGFWKFMRKLKVIESWRAALLAVRPGCADQAAATAVFEELIAELDGTHGLLAIGRLGRRGLRRLRGLPRDRSRTLPRVGIIGESYACIDGFTNRRVVERLNAMGIEVVSPISEYAFMSVVTRLYYRTEAKRIEAAGRFFGAPGGGDSLLSAAHGLELAGSCDGILHLYPFTCLPETSVRQVLAPFLRDRGVPYMPLSLDEQTAEEGLATRLETFAEMVRARFARRGPRDP